MSEESQPRPKFLVSRQQANTNLAEPKNSLPKDFLPEKSVLSPVPAVNIELVLLSTKHSNASVGEHGGHLSPTVSSTRSISTDGQQHKPLYRTISTDSNDSGFMRSQQSSRASLLSERSSRCSRETSSSDVTIEGPCVSGRVIPEEENESEGSNNSPDTSLNLKSSGSLNGATRRVSVDSQVLANLMTAALKLSEDARPLKEEKEAVEVDGPYRSHTWSGSSSRRSSNHLPAAGRRLSVDSRPSVSTHERVQRKRSAQPYFHSLDIPSHAEDDRITSSRRSRKTSGCIICDRKHEPTYSAPSVIIKTSVSLRHPMKRRFSEAHRVYRLSDAQLPYMEMPILSIRELMSQSNGALVEPTPPPVVSNKNGFSCKDRTHNKRESQLKAIVEKELPTFIRYTNWVNILGHLAAKQLVSPNSRQKLMNEHVTDVEKGNYFYMSVLPSQGDDAYCRLYECLKDEQDHHGHGDLLKLLNEPKKA